MTVIETPPQRCRVIARDEMRDDNAARILDAQADIAERIEACRESGGKHAHGGYDQLCAMLAPEMERPEDERRDLLMRLARKIGERHGVVN